jgi:hypothetical protein
MPELLWVMVGNWTVEVKRRRVFGHTDTYTGDWPALKPGDSRKR